MEEEKQYTLKELKEELNEKQRKCCKEYVLTFEKARSYMKAYPDSSYEAAAVSMNAFLKNPKIVQYINFIKDDIEDLTGVSKVRNISELAKIAYSSIAHLHNTWIELKDFDKLTDDQLAAIESTETKTTKMGDSDINIEQIKLKLYPKISAIQEINKMMGYNAAEKHDINGGIQYVNVSKQFPKE